MHSKTLAILTGTLLSAAIPQLASASPLVSGGALTAEKSAVENVHYYGYRGYGGYYGRGYYGGYYGRGYYGGYGRGYHGYGRGYYGGYRYY